MKKGYWICLDLPGQDHRAIWLEVCAIQKKGRRNLKAIQRSPGFQQAAWLLTEAWGIRPPESLRAGSLPGRARRTTDSGGPEAEHGTKDYPQALRS